MMEPEIIVPLVAIPTLFLLLPAMVFHYITKWRNQKTLMPNDEQMLEDLWRSAKSMERRIDTLERLINDADDSEGRDSARPRPSPEDYT